MTAFYPEDDKRLLRFEIWNSIIIIITKHSTRFSSPLFNLSLIFSFADISRIPLPTMRTGVERRLTVAAWRRQPLNNHRLDYHRRLPKVIRSRVRAHPPPPPYQTAPLTRIRNRTFTRKFEFSPKARMSTLRGLSHSRLYKSL